MSSGLRIQAPAKINLGLALVGTRADGYHLLESVFVPIAVFDAVTLQVESGPASIALDCGPALDADLPKAVGLVPSGPDNLVWRAARLFCERAGFVASIRIGLRKGIPAGAGLGGGSSDAAAVLRGLVALSGRAISPDELAAWALELGADVPFFLAPEPAFVSGIGEHIERIAGLPALAIVLVNPGKTLATADVYRTSDRLASALTKNRSGSTMRALSGLTQNVRDTVPALRDLLINDLEPAARQLCPVVGRISDRLERVGALAVSMTGSGATVFGVFDSEAAANDAAKRLRAEEAGVPGESERCWVRATRVLAHGAGPVGGFEEFLGASPNG
ncbi:MAG: 4-(cytidine 5'-diphospho)-2-C-methyl-D-erythritol kinase [Deltaproteobacteria bacterium]|nr:4-(cytidine 5'-diphospho)-2-C-methyl-D-erythritol kinase [Deltaproteobacteria bacterium]